MPDSQGSLGKLTGLLIGVLAGATVFAALLSGYELHQTTRDARHARYEHLSDQAVQVLEQSLHLGLPLDDLQAMPPTLARLASNDPKISYFDVLSPSGIVLYSSQASRVKTSVSDAMSAQASKALGGRWSATQGGESVLGHQVSNSFNLPVAWVVMGFDERAALTESRNGAVNLAWIAAGAGALACALLALALRYWRPKKVVVGDWRIMLALGLAIALMMGCVAIAAYQAAAPSVTADAQRKVDLLTRGLAARLQQAHDLGLPLNKVPGVEEAIRDLMAHNTEIAQTRVMSNGNLLASVGVASATTDHARDDAGLVQTRLQLGSDPPIELAVLTRVDPRYAQRLLFELAADLLILLIVVVFLARELLFWRMAQHGQGSAASIGESDDTAMDARLSGLSGLRLPFLLLMLAEDFSRGFMPLFGASLPAWFVEVSRPVALGVPLAVFMACVAFSQPLFGGWVSRVGIKRVFVTGAVLSAVAHALSAFAPSFELLVVCRAGAGVAWALAFIGTQAALLANPDPVTRARQLAAFVSVIMVSLVCGPSLGGFVADALGAKVALLGASGLAVLALVVVWRARAAVRRSRLPVETNLFAQRTGVDLQRNNMIDDDLRVPPAGLVWALLRNPRFIGLLLLAAMPAKLMLVALCFYWVPVLAAQAGESAAMAGRMMMIYAIVMVVCAPLAARLAQHLRPKLGARTDAVMVSAGLLLSSVGGFGLWGLSGLVAVSWAMLLLGVGQSLGLTPQVGVLQRVASDSIVSHGSNAVFGYYRLAERTGSALAPLVCAGLTAAIGLHSSVLVVAVGALVCAVLFAGFFAGFFKRSPRAVMGGVQ